MQRYRTVHTWVECTSGLNSTCIKDIRIVVQTEYESAMHYGRREGKWSCMLHSLHQQNYNFKSGKVIIPLFSALVRSHISKRILITVPSSGHAFRRIQINWNTLKSARGLEIKLYKERLKEPGSLVKGCLWVGWGGRVYDSILQIPKRMSYWRRSGPVLSHFRVQDTNNGFKLQEGRFQLNVRKGFLAIRAIQQ